MQVLAAIIVIVWVGMVIVGVIGLVRGRVRWARIGSRKAAGWVLAGSVPVFVLVGVVAPEQDSVRPVEYQSPGPGTSTAASAGTATFTPTPTTTTTTVPAPAPLVSVPAPVTSTAVPPAPAPVRPPVPTSVAVAAPPPVEVPAAPAPTRAAPSTWVTPGAFCSSEGATGYTKTGKLMVCETTATDSKLRWRQA